MHMVGWKRAIAVLGFLPLIALGQAREVKGTVYSFMDSEGRRVYTSKPPASTDGLRTIKYTYYEGQKALPPYIFRCQVGNEQRYFSEPFVGCVVVGTVEQPRLTFGGFDCNADCAGHQAGYDWAAKANVRDPALCSGKSQSFVEGCMVRARGIAP